MRVPLELPADTRAFDVIGVGQNSVDTVVVLADPLTRDRHVRAARVAHLPGGEVATALVACARLGCRAAYLGTFGNDAPAALIEQALRTEGVDLAGARRIDAPNRLAVILVDTRGGRTVIWHRDPHLNGGGASVDAAAVGDGRVLLLDASDPDAACAAARAARAAGMPSVLDIDAASPDVVPLLALVDIVIASATFAAAYAGADSPGLALRRLAAAGPALSIVTLGEDGSLAFCRGAEIRTPAFPVSVVDTTGAGDAFRGGFVASWLRFGDAHPLENLLRCASAVAALNCRSLGAQSGLPVWSDVDVLVTGPGYGRSK